jgi:hypothetical protein
MQTMEEMLAETKKLHDEQMRLLTGIHLGKLTLPPDVNKLMVMAELRDDIQKLRSMMKRYGWRDVDAERD